MSESAILGVSLLVPRLSGFQDGVTMTFLLAFKGKTAQCRMQDRVRNTHKLLMTAALIVSVDLIATNFVTTMLNPPRSSPGRSGHRRAGVLRMRGPGVAAVA